MTAPYIIQIIIGFIGLIALAVPFSNNAKIINYKYIAYGVLSQIILAAILLKIPLVVDAFAMLGEGVTILQKATVEGAGFVFGYPPSDSAALFHLFSKPLHLESCLT